MDLDAAIDALEGYVRPRRRAPETWWHASATRAAPRRRVTEAAFDADAPMAPRREEEPPRREEEPPRREKQPLSPSRLLEKALEDPQSPLRPLARPPWGDVGRLEKQVTELRLEERSLRTGSATRKVVLLEALLIELAGYLGAGDAAKAPAGAGGAWARDVRAARLRGGNRMPSRFIRERALVRVAAIRLGGPGREAYSVEACRGTAAGAAWIFRGDESRRRRGCRVARPRGRRRAGEGMRSRGEVNG